MEEIKKGYENMKHLNIDHVSISGVDVELGDSKETAIAAATGAETMNGDPYNFMDVRIQALLIRFHRLPGSLRTH